MLLRHLRRLFGRVPGLALLCMGFGGLCGFLAVWQPKLAVAVLGGGVLFGLATRAPVWIALLCLPGSFLVNRLSVGRGIALPDILLGLATLLSLPALARLGVPRGVSNVWRWFMVYALAMALSLAVNPTTRALVEAGHRTLLVSGAVAVGAWIYLEGRSRLGLRLLVGAAFVVAAACILTGAAHGFSNPAQPLGLQKNYGGSVLGLAILVGLAAPDELAVHPKVRILALAVLSGGLAATHSRAGMFALVVGAFVWFFRTHRDYRRRSFLLAVALGVGFLLYAGRLAETQLANKVASQNTNSLAVRNKTNSATITLWKTSPIVGVGIYYYNDSHYQEINRFLVAPTNAVVEALAEGGIVLAAGFILFQLGALTVLFRRRNELAVAGMAMVADRLFHGMFDIYWTAGNTSLPWIVAGMGLAQAALATRPQAGGSTVAVPDEQRPPLTAATP